jgi:hypothetical protein
MKAMTGPTVATGPIAGRRLWAGHVDPVVILATSGEQTVSLQCLSCRMFESSRSLGIGKWTEIVMNVTLNDDHMGPIRAAVSLAAGHLKA